MEWEEFDNWMKKLKWSWENKNSQAAADLCSLSGFKYYESEFKPPLTTKLAVTKVWQEVPEDQSNIKFNYNLLLTTPDEGYAHWQVSFDSKAAGKVINLDGIFVVRLDKEGLCKEFHQWWIAKK